MATTLVVAPIVSISPDIPPRIPNRLYKIVVDEVQANPALKIATPDPLPQDTTAETALQTARAEFAAAKAALDTRHFRSAEQKVNLSIEAFKAASAAQHSIDEFASTFELSAAIHYALGQDEQGASALQQAFAIAPLRSIEAAQRSPLYTRVVDEQRRQSEMKPRGALQFDTMPPGLPIEIDGTLQGTSPAVIREISAGLHLFRIHLPHRNPMSGMAVVHPNQLDRIQISAPDALAIDRLMIRLALNQIDTAFLNAAQQFATENRADAVLIAGIQKTPEGFTLHSCWYELKTNAVRRLAPVRFDGELLSARLNVAPFAQKLTDSNLNQLTSVNVPGAFIEALPKTPAGEVRAVDSKGAVKPVDRSPRRRVPLRSVDSKQGSPSP